MNITKVSFFFSLFLFTFNAFGACPNQNWVARPDAAFGGCVKRVSIEEKTMEFIAFGLQTDSIVAILNDHITEVVNIDAVDIIVDSSSAPEKKELIANQVSQIFPSLEFEVVSGSWRIPEAGYTLRKGWLERY